MFRISLALAVFGCGCIWQDRCVGEAVRVDGRCVILDDDAGPPTDAGDAEDAGGPGGDGGIDSGNGDAGGSDAGCTARSESCNGVDDDCDGHVDEGVQGLVGAPVRVLEDSVTQGDVAVVADGDAYLVAYESSSDERAYVSWLGTTGDVISGPHAVNSGSTDPQVTLNLSRVDADRLVVVWGERGATTTIRARLIGETGPVGSAVDVGSTPDPGYPAVAVSGGRVVIAWREPTTLRARSFAADLSDPSGIVNLSSSERWYPVLISVQDTTPFMVVAYVDRMVSDDRAYVDRLLLDPLMVENNPRLLSDDARSVEEVRGVYAAGTLAFVVAYQDGVELVSVDPTRVGTSLDVADRVELTGGAVVGPETPSLAYSSAGYDALLAGEFDGYRIDAWNVSQDLVPGPVGTFGGATTVPSVGSARLSHAEGAAVYNAVRLGGSEVDLWFQRLGCPE